MSKDLAECVKASTTGKAQITTQGFGAEAETSTATVWEIVIMDRTGKYYPTSLFDWQRLDLEIPQVPQEVAIDALGK